MRGPRVRTGRRDLAGRCASELGVLARSWGAVGLRCCVCRDAVRRRAVLRRRAVRARPVRAGAVSGQAGEKRWSLMRRAAPVTPAAGPNSPRTMGRLPVASGSDWR